MGTEQECAAGVRALRAGFEVQEVSSFRPNRGESVLGRVYVEAEPWRLDQYGESPPPVLPQHAANLAVNLGSWGT